MMINDEKNCWVAHCGFALSFTVERVQCVTLPKYDSILYLHNRNEKHVWKETCSSLSRWSCYLNKVQLGNILSFQKGQKLWGTFGFNIYEALVVVSVEDMYLQVVVSKLNILYWPRLSTPLSYLLSHPCNPRGQRLNTPTCTASSRAVKLPLLP